MCAKSFHPNVQYILGWSDFLFFWSDKRRHLTAGQVILKVQIQNFVAHGTFKFTFLKNSRRPNNNKYFCAKIVVKLPFTIKNTCKKTFEIGKKISLCYSFTDNRHNRHFFWSVFLKMHKKDIDSKNGILVVFGD